MANTHLCGIEAGKDRCPDLLVANKEGMKYKEKPLKIYSSYCTAGGRCRCLGNLATFTGNSPTWCPRRKELEGRE